MSRETSIQFLEQRQRLLEWSQRVADCRQSGLSVKRRCEENGVALKTYYSWQKKVFSFLVEQQKLQLEAEEQRCCFVEVAAPQQVQQEPSNLMDALLAWASAHKAVPKSALGKALYYLKEQWPYLVRVLEDGRLELSNNLAERSIKPFVIGRKNFLFANTPRGAQISAVIYSIIETAKANGLDPYRYLTWVLTTAPVLAAQGEGWASSLLPAMAPPTCQTVQMNT